MVPSAAAWRCLQPARYNRFFNREEIRPWWPSSLTFDLDIQTFERARTKHFFTVNLAQIRSAVPEIFDSQTKWQTVTDSAKNRTSRSLLRAVTNPRRRTAAIFKKSKNHSISATVWPITSNLCMMTHSDPLNCTQGFKNDFFKNPRWQTVAISAASKVLF